MPNAINYAEKYQDELDQLFVQEALTNDLETQRVNWMGARTFQVPSLTVSGYKNHSRNGGYNRGDVEVTHEPYTLGFDRDVEFFVDQMDVDESNQAASASNVTGEFLRSEGYPEVDAYRFSKLATKAIDLGNNTAEDLTAADALTALRRDIKALRKYGTANLIAYVSSDVMDAVADWKADKGGVSLQNESTTVETRVTVVDGVRLKEVFDIDRFHTSFDFTAGFSPAVGSFPINHLIVNKKSQISKKKLNSIYLHPPGGHTEGDGYLYQNRLYHDTFVLKNQADGIRVSHGTTAQV